MRIADADRVRLGAHLATGTTVMQEGFVNFNAGTLGHLDGRGPHRRRASSSATAPTSAPAPRSWARCPAAARRSSRSASAAWSAPTPGIGISLGDDCVVEAGCYVTAGSKVTLPDGRVVKARELSGVDGLLFLRNSVTGALEARPRNGTGIALNAALHAND